MVDSIIYRALTERKNIDLVRMVLRRHRLDYSAFFGVGSFQLAPERSMAIEFAMTSYEAALAAAIEIGQLNNQSSILFQELPVTNRLITIPRADFDCAVVARLVRSTQRQ
jgi:hypothetical protein